MDLNMEANYVFCEENGFSVSSQMPPFFCRSMSFLFGLAWRYRHRLSGEHPCAKGSGFADPAEEAPVRLKLLIYIHARNDLCWTCSKLKTTLKRAQTTN